MWVSIIKKLINKDHCDQISDLSFNVYINKKKEFRLKKINEMIWYSDNKK